MVDFIQNLIGNEYLATFAMSFVPLIELKGAIVFARGVGLGVLLSFIISYFGSTLVFMPIYFLLKPILNLLKKIKWFNKFACKVETYFQEKADGTIKEQREKNGKKQWSDTFLKQLGVFIFVAIPLPMTGVWTGTAIAVFLGLKFKECALPIILGNFIAGLIITLLAEICLFFGSIKTLDYVLYILFALAVVLFLIVVIKVIKKKPQDKKEDN